MQIALGIIEGAKEAYGKALSITKAASGHESKATAQLQELFENTPTTVEELMFHYKNIQDAVDEMKFEDDLDGLKEIEEAKQKMKGT